MLSIQPSTQRDPDHPAGSGVRGSGQGISRSRYAEQLYGWTAAEILGQSASALVPPEMLEQGQEIIARLRRGERWSGEFVVRRRDGSTFPALVTDSPLRDHLGNLVGIAGVLRLVELHAALPEDVRELLPEAVVS